MISANTKKERFQKVASVLLTSLVFFINLFGQSSFIKTLDFSNISELNNESIIYRVVEDNNGDVYMAVFLISGITIVKLNSEGEVLSSHKMISNQDWISAGSSASYEYLNGHHAMTFQGGFNNGSSGLFVFDLANNNYWAKKLSNSSLRTDRTVITPEMTILTTHGAGEEFDFPFFANLGICLLDVINGDSLWSYKYQPDLANPMAIGVYPLNITQYPNGCFSLVSIISGTSIQNASSLLQIDSEGQIIKSVLVPNSIASWLNHTTDNEGNVYVYGYIPNEEHLGINDALILKLDENYETIWAKRLVAEAFNYADMRLVVDENQNIYFSYSTFGDFPVIAGQLDREGELLWHKGYAANSPRLFVTREHELLITSRRKYFQDGSSENGLVIMKTSTDGTFDNCLTYTACLEVDDVNIELERINWTRQVSFVPPPLDVDAESLNILTEDYCPEPLLPQPYFTLPNRICPSTTIQADSLENEFANQVQWQITGAELDTIIRENNFSLQINAAGKYMVTQTVWVLGCSSSFSRSIEVMDESSIDILPNDLLVCDDEYLLTSQLLFSDSATFIWNNGSNANGLTIQIGGLYAVSVNENDCIYTDSINVQFLNELLPKPVISQVADTTICVENLPYSLTPYSAYSDTFWIEGRENDANTSILLENEGVFQIISEVENCLIQSSFNLSIESCEAEIYLPNVFSPNNDGVNDVFEPLGNNFTGVELLIFDRWGNLLFQQIEAPFKWKGEKDNQLLSQGVYVVVFNFINKLTMEKETILQDVLLLR